MGGVGVRPQEGAHDEGEEVPDSLRRRGRHAGPDHGVGRDGVRRTALPRNAVGTPQLKAGAVTAVKVHDRAITARKLKPKAVTSDKVADSGITSADLAEGAVGTSQLADGSITTVKIGAGQITEGHLFPGSVGSAAVADQSLTLADLAGGQNNPLTAGLGMEAESCLGFSGLPVPGAQPGQLVTGGWLQAPPQGVVIASTSVAGPNAVALNVCNVSNTSVSVPGGATFRIVTFG